MLAVLAAKWPYRIARWTLATVFIYAGVIKQLHIQAFAETISQFGLAGDNQVALETLAVSLAALEAIAGIALLWDVWGSLAVIAALLLSFVGILSYGLWIGLDIACGCFGAAHLGLTGPKLQHALLLDLAMLGVCAYLYASRYARWTHTRPPVATL